MPSDKKLRGKRPRKRENHGNQHTGQCSAAKRKRTEAQHSATSPVSDGSNGNEIASTSSTTVSATPTSSEKKKKGCL